MVIDPLARQHVLELLLKWLLSAGSFQDFDQQSQDTSMQLRATACGIEWGEIIKFGVSPLKPFRRLFMGLESEFGVLNDLSCPAIRGTVPLHAEPGNFLAELFHLNRRFSLPAPQL